jgi:hypothetical protein
MKQIRTKYAKISINPYAIIYIGRIMLFYFYRNHKIITLFRKNKNSDNRTKIHIRNIKIL